MKTYTVEGMIEELKKYPPTLPIFYYDIDEEQDAPISIIELAGATLEPDDEGNLKQYSPYYCKGVSYIEDYWKSHGHTPILCFRNFNPWTDNERKE